MNRRKSPRYKLILNIPDRVAPHTKIGSSLFTVLFWLAFVYLWMPIITAVAWMAGFYHSYSEMIYIRELTDLRHTALVYTMIVVVLGGSLLLWALHQYLRFRNVNRRREPVPVEHHELAKHVNLPVQVIQDAQATRRLTAHHSGNGKVTRFV